MTDEAPKPRPPPTREEYEALLARVAALEARLRAAPPPAPAPAPAPFVPAERFYPPQPPQVYAPPAQVALPPPPETARPAPAKKANLESVLGQRFAPRVGALLVFLAALFFLGVAIQRGWIGPLAQLAIAALAGLALVGGGEWLATRRGYGTYPQVLQGTGAAVLYLTAFSAHAIPHFSRETRLDTTGGAVLMAIVAAATVALALRHDARVIAALGYGLSFVTAGLGFGVLPALTLPYVGALGASLALLVARKRWHVEGLAGSVATGAFLAAFAIDAARLGSPSPYAVLAVAAVPAAAFAWLTLRPSAERSRDDATVALEAGATTAWASAVLYWFAEALMDGPAVAASLVVACAGAAALAVLAWRFRAHAGVGPVYAAGAVVLYLLWPLRAWEDDPQTIGIPAAYALGALALALAERAPRVPKASALPLASLALGVSAALAAPNQGLIRLPGDAFDGGVAGPAAAWATLLLVAAPLALVALGSGTPTRRVVSRGAFAVLVLFLAVWAFALFRNAFSTTLWLLAAAISVFALARVASRERADLVGDALVAAAALAAFAAAKSATYDAHVTTARLPLGTAVLEAALVVGTLLALHHLGRARPSPIPEALGSAALVGGSALVAASFVFAYATGGTVSVILAILGVAYLAAGFVLEDEPVYRYTGFAALGFVLLRVFAVDLRETDLVVRAGVFAVLGAILLGVGYVYARANRRPPAESPPPAPPAAPPRPPGAP